MVAKLVQDAGLADNKRYYGSSLKLPPAGLAASNAVDIAINRAHYWSFQSGDTNRSEPNLHGACYS
jgi:hypothetical protein